MEADLAPTPENPLPVREVIMDKNKNPLEAEESGLWPYIVSTNKICSALKRVIKPQLI